MSLHWFVLSASVISDFGLPPVVPVPIAFATNQLPHPFFFCLPKGVSVKQVFCVFFSPHFFFCIVLSHRTPQRGLGSSHSCCNTQLLPPQLHERGPTTALGYSSGQEELSSIVSSMCALISAVMFLTFRRVCGNQQQESPGDRIS